MREINALTVVAAMCFAAGVFAAPPKSYTIDHEIKFEPGDPKWTARLRNIAEVGDLVDYEYMIALEDLNDDQKPEVIVMASSSDFCGSGGCSMVVLEDRGSGRLDPILRQYVTPPVGCELVIRPQMVAGRACGNGFATLLNGCWQCPGRGTGGFAPKARCALAVVVAHEVGELPVEIC